MIVRKALAFCKNTRSFLTACRYRPPSNGMDYKLFNALKYFLSQVMPKHNLVILGDFYATHSSWYAPDSTCPNGRYLKLITSEFSLREFVHFRHAFCHSEVSDSLLDLVFINVPEVVHSARSLSPLSDHLPILLYTHLQTSCFSRKKNHKYNQ